MWVIFKIKYAAFCNFCCYSNYYGTFYSWKSTSGISQTLKLYWKENLVQYWDLVLWVYFSKPIAFPNLSLLITIFTRHFTSNFQMPSLEAQLVNVYCGGERLLEGFIVTTATCRLFKLCNFKHVIFCAVLNRRKPREMSAATFKCEYAEPSNNRLKNW